MKEEEEEARKDSRRGISPRHEEKPTEEKEKKKQGQLDACQKYLLHMKKKNFLSAMLCKNNKRITRTTTWAAPRQGSCGNEKEKPWRKRGIRSNKETKWNHNRWKNVMHWDLVREETDDCQYVQSAPGYSPPLPPPYCSHSFVIRYCARPHHAGCFRHINLCSFCQCTFWHSTEQ